MKPYYETKNGKLYHGDCLEIMPEIETVDFVITSPPYNMGISAGGGLSGAGDKGKWKSASRKGGLAQGYESYDDSIPWPEYERWQKNVLKTAYSLLPNNGAIFYNHKPRPWNGEIRLPTIYNPGLPLRQIVIWRRNGGINFSTTHYCPSCEWILIFSKHEFKLKSKGASSVFDVWDLNSVPYNKHPCPFPLQLPIKILGTLQNGSVLDPFFGAGTTAIACEELNRKWIGVEISEKYCEIAAKRIESETKQLKLF